MSRQLILFNFANYSPSTAMELKVSKEITCKRQNQRKICLLSIIFELAKPVRLNSFQKPYFQSVSIFFRLAVFLSDIKTLILQTKISLFCFVFNELLMNV